MTAILADLLGLDDEADARDLARALRQHQCAASVRAQDGRVLLEVETQAWSVEDVERVVWRWGFATARRRSGSYSPGCLTSPGPWRAVWRVNP